MLFLVICCAAALGVQAQTIVVEDGRCRVVDIHVPDADVAYRPGVDVNGNAVAPADLGGGNAVRTPRFVPIPVTIPLNQLLNTPPPFTDFIEVDAGLLLVDVETGYITYDGQRLDPPQAVLCDETDDGDVRILNAPPPPPERPRN